MLHYLFIYYQKDPTVMDRIKEILDKMCQLAPNYSVEPIDDIEETLDGSDEDGEFQDEEEPENPIDDIEEIHVKYDLPEQGEDEYVGSDELSS